MHPNDPTPSVPYRRVPRPAITPPGSIGHGTTPQLVRLASPSSPTPQAASASPESMIAALTVTGRYRVLCRLEARTRYEHAPGAKMHTALYVDVETTGTAHAVDKIIQLAIVPFTFTADGRVCEVRRSESWFEDPGMPISPEITRLTGIRDADVRGKQIDDGRVHSLLADADLVIAHNAAFDRPFMERRLPGFTNIAWACSMAEVPWIDEGLPTMKLEWLSEKHSGVFYDAHRADADCRAGIHLLASTLPSGRRAMAVLLERARQKTVRVWALASPFATKDALKQRGYRWSGGEDGSPKSWYRDIPQRTIHEEREWLQAHIYSTGALPAVAQRIGARVRYSHRIVGLPLRALVDCEVQGPSARGT